MNKVLSVVRSVPARVSAGSLALVCSASAMADDPTFDVADATATLGDVEEGLVLVGGVLVGLAAVAVGFKWIKGMIFG